MTVFAQFCGGLFFCLPVLHARGGAATCSAESPGSCVGTEGNVMLQHRVELSQATILEDLDSSITDADHNETDSGEGTTSGRCSWGNQTTGSIAGSNIKIYKDKTTQECKSLCEAEALCKSIDFKPGSDGKGKCLLNHCRIGEGCDNDDDKRFFYFACNPESTLIGRCVWGQQTTGSIAGHNIFAYHRKTTQECKLLCESEASCKSIDFRPDSGDEGKCLLGDCRIGEGCNNDDDTDYIYFACDPESSPPKFLLSQSQKDAIVIKHKQRARVFRRKFARSHSVHKR